MKSLTLLTAAFLAALCGLPAANAAFIVEPHANGKAYANFSSPDGAPNVSAVGTAAGLSGVQSALGTTAAGFSPANINGWTFSYTPGVDADNTVYTAGQALGDRRIDPPGNPSGVTVQPQTATGLVGGVSGIYNVYITWPGSANVNVAGSTITVTSDDAPIVLNPVDVNGNAGGPNPFTPSGQGGTNRWLLIGTVDLTQGNTYTVNMKANSASFTSQRASGVMWELLSPAVIPEPATLLMLGLGMIGTLAIRRRS